MSLNVLILVQFLNIRKIVEIRKRKYTENLATSIIKHVKEEIAYLNKNFLGPV